MKREDEILQIRQICRFRIGRFYEVSENHENYEKRSVIVKEKIPGFHKILPKSFIENIMNKGIKKTLEVLKSLFYE